MVGKKSSCVNDVELQRALIYNKGMLVSNTDIYFSPPGFATSHPGWSASVKPTPRGQ